MLLNGVDAEAKELVWCPVCESGPLTSCAGKSGRARKTVHAGRRKALEAFRAEQERRELREQLLASQRERHRLREALEADQEGEG